MVRKASYHMIRERLWKRLLYGTQLASVGDRSKKVDDISLFQLCYIDCHLGGPGETKLFRVLFTINTGQCVSTGYIRLSTNSV